MSTPPRHDADAPTGSESWLQPRMPAADDALAPLVESFTRSLGFAPNAFLLMQARPEIARAFATLSASVFGPSGLIDNAFKRLLSLAASRAAGCPYSTAHAAGAAERAGASQARIDAVLDGDHVTLFDDGERAALDLAVASASSPATVAEEMMRRMRARWSEAQIVEIAGCLALFGFLNRWNAVMATPLEAEPMVFAQERLAPKGWSPGHHAR